MSVEDFHLANGTLQAARGAHVEPALQHRLSPIVETRLTQVVHGLRASWLAGPAQFWGDVHPIREMSLGECEQRIATTLACGFLQFSELLAGFEVLVLQLEQSGVVREQSILHLEQLIVQGRRFFRDQVEVPYSDQGLCHVFGNT